MISSVELSKVATIKAAQNISEILYKESETTHVTV
jgi:hypothetical protein